MINCDIIGKIARAVRGPLLAWREHRGGRRFALGFGRDDALGWDILHDHNNAPAPNWGQELASILPGDTDHGRDFFQTASLPTGRHRASGLAKFSAVSEPPQAGDAVCWGATPMLLGGNSNVAQGSTLA